MCPLRVILLFLSALLAGYFAVKTVRAQGSASILDLSEVVPEESSEKTSMFRKVSTRVSSGFWVVVDMLSGRYLYQNLKGQLKSEAAAR